MTQLFGVVVFVLSWIFLFELLPLEAGGETVAFLGGLISGAISLGKKIFSKRPSRGALPPAPGLPARTGRAGRAAAVGRGFAAGAATGPVVRRLAPDRPSRGPRHLHWKRQPDPKARFRGGQRHHEPVTPMRDKFGRPMAVEAAFREVTHCPSGYVAVQLPNGRTVCMLKGPAQRAGLWKSRSKPPISAGDWKKLKVANRVKKKARKIAETAGGKVKGLPRK